MSSNCQRLVIVGAGDFAREVLWIAQEIQAAVDVPWAPAGFLDDNVDGARERLKGYGVSLPVLGAISSYEPQANDVFACAIAAPRPKLAICEALQARGARFVNLLHPTAVVAPGSRIGVGIVAYRYATVSVNVTVGNFVVLNMFSSIGHDAVLGDGCTLSSHVDITGHVRVGRGVFLGSHASVLPKAKIGNFATVGAGSVVLRSVKEETSVIGVPAKRFD